jgi:hypothetical protein
MIDALRVWPSTADMPLAARRIITSGLAKRRSI